MCLTNEDEDTEEFFCAVDDGYARTIKEDTEDIFLDVEDGDERTLKMEGVLQLWTDGFLGWQRRAVVLLDCRLLLFATHTTEFCLETIDLCSSRLVLHHCEPCRFDLEESETERVWCFRSESRRSLAEWVSFINIAQLRTGPKSSVLPMSDPRHLIGYCRLMRERRDELCVQLASYEKFLLSEYETDRMEVRQFISEFQDFRNLSKQIIEEILFYLESFTSQYLSTSVISLSFQDRNRFMTLLEGLKYCVPPELPAI